MQHTLLRLFTGLLALCTLATAVFILLAVLVFDSKTVANDKVMFLVMAGMASWNTFLLLLVTFNRYRRGLASFLAWFFMPWLIFTAVDNLRQIAFQVPIEGAVLGGLVVIALLFIGFTYYHSWLKETLLVLSILAMTSFYFAWDIQYRQFHRESSELDASLSNMNTMLTGSTYRDKVCVPPLSQITDKLIDELIAREKAQRVSLYTYLPDEPPVDIFLSAIESQAEENSLELFELSSSEPVPQEFFQYVEITGVAVGSKTAYSSMANAMSDGDWIVNWADPVQENSQTFRFRAKLYAYRLLSASGHEKAEICPVKPSKVWMPPYTQNLQEKKQQLQTTCADVKHYAHAYEKLQGFREFTQDVVQRYEVFSQLKEQTTNPRIRDYKMNMFLPCLE